MEYENLSNMLAVLAKSTFIYSRHNVWIVRYSIEQLTPFFNRTRRKKNVYWPSYITVSYYYIFVTCYYLPHTQFILISIISFDPFILCRYTIYMNTFIQCLDYLLHRSWTFFISIFCFSFTQFFFFYQLMVRKYCWYVLEGWKCPQWIYACITIYITIRYITHTWKRSKIRKK